MIPEFNGVIMSFDYKIFLASIYLAGLLTGGVIGAVVLTYKEAQWRKVNE